MTIQPFAHTGDNFTTLTNYMLDIIMPELPANAWEVLCYIHRKTHGWNKESDELSYTQIAAGTGIKSSATISEALKLLEKKQYIIKTIGDKWDTVSYRINVALETEAKPIASETKATSETEAKSLQKSKREDHSSLQKLNTQKKDSKEKKERVSANASAPRTPRKKSEKQPPKETTPIGIIKALATACQIDRDLASKETHIILANAAERLYKAGKGKEQTDEQIAETIRYVGGYFMKNDWRGKKGEPPTPGQLLDIWKRAIDARQTAAPETKYYQSQAHKYLQGDELRAAFDEAARKRARIRSVGEA